MSQSTTSCVVDLGRGDFRVTFSFVQGPLKGLTLTHGEEATHPHPLRPDPMQILQVGQRHPALRPPTPEGSFFNWSKSGLELLVSFREPSAKEIAAVRKASCEFALAVLDEAPAAVWLLYRFGDALPWSDAPYCSLLLAEADQPDLVLFVRPGQRLLLEVVLADSPSGVVRAMRQTTLSPEFSRDLVAAVQAQVSASWPGPAIYRANVADVQARLSSEDLLLRALARCLGGED